MALKQCDKCSEMVEEAKAFCPGCGHAFVTEEKRQNVSEFEQKGNTVQFGQTMYNQMLSDMGLNVSKLPDLSPKRIEVIAPAAAPVSVQPAVKPPVAQPEKPKLSSNRTLYIIGGILLLLGFLIVAAGVIGTAVYYNWDRLR